MQKKRNIKSKAIDLAIIILCLAGSTVSAKTFWQVYNRTLSKLNEEPVATLIFKQRTAQRRFADRFVWDMLRESSPLYNGDTVRTIELSEAVIALKDEESKLTLYENTMIKIFFNNKEGAIVDLSGGNLGVDSGSATVTVVSGTSMITVEGQADFIMSEEGLSFSVLEGSVNFDGEEIEAGSILSIDQDGVLSIKPAIAMTSFGSSARILGAEGEATPVVFSWNESNFTSETFVIIEIALDRFFTRVVGSRDVIVGTSVTIPIESGSFWWRAYPAIRGSREPANDIYPSGSLEIIPASGARLITPANSAEIRVLDNTDVSFFWTSVKGASSYILEISANANMSSPVVNRKVTDSGIIHGGLNPGKWYWRITPVFPDWITGSMPSSAVSEFTLVARPVSAEPTATEASSPRTSESHTIAESLSTATFLQLPVIAASGWNSHSDPASVSRVSTRRGEIDGQEKEIISIEINIPNLSPGEPRWAGALLNDESISQKLRAGSGIRFKALGDGKDWIVIVPTSDIRAGGPTFRAPVSTRNGRVIEVNIPFSQLTQPDWGARATFNKGNITNLIFERNDSHTEGRSEIKIFDFEVF